MTTTTIEREANEAAAIELLGLFEAKKAIQEKIDDIKQAYIGTWDDDEATALRIEWRKLRAELREAERAIGEFAESLK